MLSDSDSICHLQSSSSNLTLSFQAHLSPANLWPLYLDDPTSRTWDSCFEGFFKNIQSSQAPTIPLVWSQLPFSAGAHPSSGPWITAPDTWALPGPGSSEHTWLRLSPPMDTVKRYLTFVTSSREGRQYLSFALARLLFGYSEKVLFLN